MKDYIRILSQAQCLAICELIKPEFDWQYLPIPYNVSVHVCIKAGDTPQNTKDIIVIDYRSDTAVGSDVRYRYYNAVTDLYNQTEKVTDIETYINNLGLIIPSVEV